MSASLEGEEEPVKVKTLQPDQVERNLELAFAWVERFRSSFSTHL